MRRISIRRTRSDESDLLCKLDVGIFGEEDGFDSPEMWEGLETFFILVDDQVVGSIAMRHNTGIAGSYNEDYVDQPGSLYIVSTGLVPEWQGKKVGSFAKAWQIGYATGQGFKKIVTNARQSNSRSINLNKRFGFQEVCSIPNWYGNEATIVLEFEL